MEDRQGEQTVLINMPKTLLAAYGTREEIRELAERLRRTLFVTPPGQDPRQMSANESLMLAAASLAHGLDPLTREVWLLFDKRGTPVIYTGPVAYQKAAAKQIADQGGGNFWPTYYPITDPDERALYLIPAGAVAWKCQLRDTPTMRTYTEAVAALTAAGAKWASIEAALGTQPYTEGIGIYIPTNSTRGPDEMWNPNLRAKKRAFHAALKQRFNLPFVGESDGDLPPAFTGQYLPEPTAASAASGAPAADATVENTPKPKPAPAAEVVVDSKPVPAASGAPAMTNAEADAIIAAEDAKRAAKAKRGAAKAHLYPPDED